MMSDGGSIFLVYLGTVYFVFAPEVLPLYLDSDLVGFGLSRWSNL